MTADNPFHSFLPDFPGISSANAEATSPADLSYNCIAHAGGDSGRWWWPDPFGDSFWPPTAKREVTVNAFVDAYRSLGYEPRDAITINSGDECIALFAKEGMPTHAARQLPDGRWTSKLGREIDIVHDLEAIEGPTYGKVVQFLRRSGPV